MQTKAFPSASRKLKAKPRASAEARARVSTETLEQLTERVVERVVTRVVKLREPSRVPEEVIERTLSKVGQRWVSEAHDSVARLVASQHETQQRFEEMSKVLTFQHKMLVALLESSPPRAQDFAELVQRLERVIASVGGLQSRGHRSLDADAGTRHPSVVVPQDRSDEEAAQASARWAERVERGEALRAAWVKDGLLVSSATLSRHWHRTRQALDQACTRGELFFVKVGKNKYYPAAFVELDADAVKQVNLALKGDDGTAKFIFWSRKHGALGNRTVLEALGEGRLARVVELAQGWSEERGLVEAPST